MRRAPRLVRLAAVLVVASGSAALAGACGDELTPLPPVLDGGDDTGSVASAECPKAEPSNGSRCLLPEGTTCDFGQCGTRLARCTRGAWKVGGNPPPQPPCPMAPPNPDTDCPPCWPVGASCTYGSSDCSQADASDNTATARCSEGAKRTWLLVIRPCRDGGGEESGSDVQGDGGADAD